MNQHSTMGAGRLQSESEAAAARIDAANLAKFKRLFADDSSVRTAPHTLKAPDRAHSTIRDEDNLRRRTRQLSTTAGFPHDGESAEKS